METFLATIVIFGICMLGMALGTIFYGKKLKDSCCSGGSCIKKEKEVCPGEHNKNAGLVRMATVGSPGKEHR